MKLPWRRSAPATFDSTGYAASAPPAPMQRKPRILIAGEFSAGKTRLINGLIGASVLPSNVTATALPPVWLTRGEPALIRVANSGRAEALADLDEVTPDSTVYCALTHPAPILSAIDIIDTPGNSDPNMAAEAWQRMLAFADAVVWCTNATQAWRQSEKAVWQAMPARLRQNATIVVTHADLLGSPTMAARVLQRVEREAGAYFATFIMASSLDQGDLDRITQHLRQLSGALRPGGEANALIGDFAAANPVRTRLPVREPENTPESGSGHKQQRQPERATRPQYASPEVRPLAPLLGKQAFAAAHVAARPLAQPAPRATVLPLMRRPHGDDQASDAASARAAAPQGRARALWSELSKSMDPSDPASVLAAVEHLIARMDGQAARTGTEHTAPVTAPGISGPAAGVYE